MCHGCETGVSPSASLGPSCAPGSAAPGTHGSAAHGDDPHGDRALEPTVTTDHGVGLLGGESEDDPAAGHLGAADLGRCRRVGREHEGAGGQGETSRDRVDPGGHPRAEEVDGRRVGGHDMHRDTPGRKPVGGTARHEARAGERLSGREAGDEATADGVIGIDDRPRWGAPRGSPRPHEVVGGEHPAGRQLARGQEDRDDGRWGRPQLVEHEEDAHGREGCRDPPPHDGAPPPGTPAPEGGEGVGTSGHAATLGAARVGGERQAERVDGAAAGAEPVDDVEEPDDPDDPDEPDDPVEVADPEPDDEPSPDEEDPDEPFDDPPSDDDPDDDPEDPLGTEALERLSVR